MDRPARTKKSVDYSQFLDLEDDDEDFASSAPASKKARVETKREKKEKPLQKSHKEEAATTNSQPKRRPLEDKLYERDLEAALTLSAMETSAIIENDENIPRNCIEAAEDAYRFLKHTDASEASFSNCSVDSSTLGLDEITGDNEDPGGGRGRRQAITEQRKVLTGESGDEEDADEFRPDTMADSDSESDASFGEEDEEFEVKKSKKAASSKVTKAKRGKKEKDVPKAQKAASPKPVIVKIKAMPAKKTPAAMPTLHSSPPVSMKRPAWTPPASSGAVRSPLLGVTVKSPNQGLRLGLSRRARVKPLHPTPALH